MRKSVKGSAASAPKATRPPVRVTRVAKPASAAAAHKRANPAHAPARPARALAKPTRASQRAPTVAKPGKAVAKPARAVTKKAVAKEAVAKLAQAADPRAPSSRLEAAAPQRVKPVVVAGTSPLLRALGAEEQRAVRQALAGTATLLASSPRARDAALFGAAASIAQHPVLVASPFAAELVEHAAHLPGVDVAAFGTFVSPATAAASKKRVARGGSLLIVVEPSQLFAASLRASLSKTPLSLLGIAAAHACCGQAHELCPAYLSLNEAVLAFDAHVLGTCPATSDEVTERAAEALGVSRSSIVRAARPALTESARVLRAAERKSALAALVASAGLPGIVLTATPQEADSVLAELMLRQIPAVRAHAGMAAVERSDALARFLDPEERLVLVTQSPHASVSGLAGCPEPGVELGSAPPRPDLRFVVHYQAPLSLEQLFEDLAWLPRGGSSLVLGDSSDEALNHALLAQQRLKPAAIEAIARALTQLPPDRPGQADTLALRASTSRRSAERVLSAFAARGLLSRDGAQVELLVSAEQLITEASLLAAGFAALRAADATRAQSVASYVTARHDPASPAAPAALEAPRSVTA